VCRLHQADERTAKGRLLLQPYKLLMPPAELPGKGLQRIMACAFRAPDIIETPFAAVIATGCLVAPMGERLGVIQGHHNRDRSGCDRRQTPCVPKTALGVTIFWAGAGKPVLTLLVIAQGGFDRVFRQHGAMDFLRA
jgi:hypothetical protein